MKRTLYQRFEGSLEGFQVADLMEGSRQWSDNVDAELTIAIHNVRNKAATESI